MLYNFSSVQFECTVYRVFWKQNIIFCLTLVVSFIIKADKLIAEHVGLVEQTGKELLVYFFIGLKNLCQWV